MCEVILSPARKPFVYLRNLTTILFMKADACVSLGKGRHRMSLGKERLDLSEMLLNLQRQHQGRVALNALRFEGLPKEGLWSSFLWETVLQVTFLRQRP